MNNIPNYVNCDEQDSKYICSYYILPECPQTCGYSKMKSKEGIEKLVDEN